MTLHLWSMLKVGVSNKHTTGTILCKLFTLQNDKAKSDFKSVQNYS